MNGLSLLTRGISCTNDNSVSLATRGSLYFSEISHDVVDITDLVFIVQTAPLRRSTTPVFAGFDASSIQVTGSSLSKIQHHHSTPEIIRKKSWLRKK